MRHHLIPTIVIAAAAALATACNKDNEYHQTYITRPAQGITLVGAEGGLDSLVFTTTESFTITTSVVPPTDNDAWYSYPDEFASFTSPAKNSIIEFIMPITFERNTTKNQRTVAFHINAGDFSADCFFVQDTLHTTPATKPTDEQQQGK